jgi:sugar porter (SP) family MFS transporter
MGYLSALLFVVSLGSIQFGYMIGSWNTASGAYGKLNGWDEDQQTTNITIVQSLTTLGAALGALFSGNIAYLGRWNCIMVANVLLVIGVGITLYNEFWVLCVGRFIYGLSVGTFSVFCPKYISEVTPREITGPAGALSQVCVTFGILVAFTIGLGIGDVEEDDFDSFQIQYYWYIVFAIPLAIALFQILLLLFIFSYDTPVFLKQKGEQEDLQKLMSKIYRTPELVQERIDEIIIEEGSSDSDLTYAQLMYDPKYRRATWVGSTLSLFQQLTGINAIMFYSNIVFKGLDISNTTVTALIGIVNFLATLVGLGLLACFGRKTLMLFFSVLMSITLILLSFFAFTHNSVGMVVCVLLFIAFFEFSTGPILWLYMAEIMKDKAVSIGTFLNWFGSLIMSVSIPILVKTVSIGYIFLAFSIFTVIGTLIILFFMKETRGKTRAEIDAMFRPDPEDS